MAAPKRTKMQIAKDRARAAELNSDGMTEQEIANIIGVSQVQIHYDLVKVRDEYKARADDAVAKKAALFDARNEQLYQEAYEKWIESQEDIVTTTYKIIASDDGEERVEETVKTTEFVGNVQFFNAAAQRLDRYAKFHGLDAPDKAEVTTIANPEHPKDIEDLITQRYNRKVTQDAEQQAKD